MLKTPISYYGGKQQMLRHILPLVPSHHTYTEAFAGGAALFFAKPPSPVEVINDTNGQLVSFYHCLQNRFEQLSRLVELTLHSRKQFDHATFIYNNPQHFPRLKVAWAVWMLSVQGFSSKLDGSFGYDRQGNSVAKKLMGKKATFGLALRDRIALTQIECTDALRVIESRDWEQAFHYVDPPYYNSNCAHYRGYSEADFELLLQLLGRVKGKFLLSSYPSSLLSRYVHEMGWQQLEVEKTIAVSGNNPKRKKVEVLTANYPLVG